MITKTATKRHKCGEPMMHDGIEWRCEYCEMRAAADRREAASLAYRWRIIDEARAFRRDGP